MALLSEIVDGPPPDHSGLWLCPATRRRRQHRPRWPVRRARRPGRKPGNLLVMGAAPFNPESEDIQTGGAAEPEHHHVRHAPQAVSWGSGAKINADPTTRPPGCVSDVMVFRFRGASV